jgi:hypothetical protein
VARVQECYSTTNNPSTNPSKLLIGNVIAKCVVAMQLLLEAMNFLLLYFKKNHRVSSMVEYGEL